MCTTNYVIASLNNNNELVRLKSRVFSSVGQLFKINKVISMCLLVYNALKTKFTRDTKQFILSIYMFILNYMYLNITTKHHIETYHLVVYDNSNHCFRMAYLQDMNMLNWII